MQSGVRRWASRIVLVVASGGCTEALERELVPESLGAVEQPVTIIGADVQASPSGEVAQSSSAAWIRSASYSNGHALVGYTAGGDRAAWARSVDWITSSPTWEAHRSDDPPPFGWPAPVNFCKVYDCSAGAAWNVYGAMDQVVWTGLDDMAAAVATGGAGSATGSDVVLVSSTDGGSTFTEARILSVPTPNGDSGGEIVPYTVHASLMYTARRRSGEAGKEATPIYVIWQAFTNEGLHWFMTRAIVGFDGGIAQPEAPVRVSIIPPNAAAHASIMAFEDDNRDEVVQVAWSERTDSSGAPSPGPSCPSNETLHVTWRSSGTRDFGKNWGCWPSQPGGFCQPVSFLIHKDKEWRPCVGPSFSEAGDAPPYGVNNDRPELVMNRGLPYGMFAAINHSVPAGGMRTAVYQSDPWQPIYLSPDEDPETGTPVGDAWGQALAVIQGTMLPGIPLPTYTGALAVTYREVDPEGVVSMAAASTLDNLSSGGGWKEERLTSQRWKLAGNLGRHTGLAALELCVDEPCSGGAPAVYPAVPFFAAWTDARNDGAAPEVWARAFTPD